MRGNEIVTRLVELNERGRGQFGERNGPWSPRALVIMISWNIWNTLLNLYWIHIRPKETESIDLGIKLKKIPDLFHSLTFYYASTRGRQLGTNLTEWSDFNLVATRNFTTAIMIFLISRDDLFHPPFLTIQWSLDWNMMNDRCEANS